MDYAVINVFKLGYCPLSVDYFAPSCMCGLFGGPEKSYSATSSHLLFSVFLIKRKKSISCIFDLLRSSNFHLTQVKVKYDFKADLYSSFVEMSRSLTSSLAVVLSVLISPVCLQN